MEPTIEKVFSNDNVAEAIAHLATKNNTAGIDGVKLSELAEYWEVNQEEFLLDLENYSYRPGIVKEIEIVMKNGKKRLIIRMNAIDRLILRCLTQSLQPYFDLTFNQNSFAYRPNKGVPKATQKVVTYLKDNYHWVAEIDVKDFFDTIPIKRIDSLINVLIQDQRLAKLISSFLYPTVEKDFVLTQKKVGILQGSALSPLLSNLFLTELDNDLSNKHWHFVRYGDNVTIYGKSYEDALNKFNYVKKQLENHFELYINSHKSGI